MKTKALISLAVTVKLTCSFVLAYADCWFSHAAAHIKYEADQPTHTILYNLLFQERTSDFFLVLVSASNKSLHFGLSVYSTAD